MPDFFFHTIFFKGKFYTDSGSRLTFAKLLNGLAEKFPTEKIPQLKHLIECNVLCFSDDLMSIAVGFCSSLYVVRHASTVDA